MPFFVQVNPVVHSIRGFLGYSRVPYNANAAEPGEDSNAASPNGKQVSQSSKLNI